MNPADTTDTSDVTAQPTLGVRLSSLWSHVLANRYTLPAITVVLGFLVGIGLMAVVMPKPIDPVTYTKPLQAQTASLQQQARYARVVTLNYTLLVAHYNQLVTDINASDVSAAETDATKLSTSTGTFINDLKKTPVPACLKATNAALLAGLADIQQGASSLDKSLVANDVGQASADAEQMTKGLNQVTTAEDAYAAATC